MALLRDLRYAGRFKAPTAGQPQGAFKNRTSPSAKDGSYLEEDWLNDWSGFFSSLLADGGLTANGNVDAVGASQYRDALLNVILKRKSLTVNDYVRIPDVPGGLIIQWLTVSSSASAALNVSLPIVFPTVQVLTLASVLNNTQSTVGQSTVFGTDKVTIGGWATNTNTRIATPLSILSIGF